MNAAAAKKPKASKPRKPVYLTVEKLVRPSTGEIVGAFVPSTQWDIRAVRDRQYKTGATVRAELKKPRNTKFHRLAHAIGALAVDHVEGFEAMETHDALKKLQSQSGICCEESEIDAKPVIDAVLAAVEVLLGKPSRILLEDALSELKTIRVRTAQSIAFDSMPEEEFSKLVHGICQYLREKYHGVPPGEIAESIAAVEEGHA